MPAPSAHSYTLLCTAEFALHILTHCLHWLLHCRICKAHSYTLLCTSEYALHSAHSYMLFALASARYNRNSPYLSVALQSTLHTFVLCKVSHIANTVHCTAVEHR